jgi:hypothetical protein
VNCGPLFFFSKMRLKSRRPHQKTHTNFLLYYSTKPYKINTSINPKTPFWRPLSLQLQAWWCGRQWSASLHHLFQKPHQATQWRARSTNRPSKNSTHTACMRSRRCRRHLLPPSFIDPSLGRMIALAVNVATTLDNPTTLHTYVHQHTSIKETRRRRCGRSHTAPPTYAYNKNLLQDNAPRRVNNVVASPSSDMGVQGPPKNSREEEHTAMTMPSTR